MASNNILSPIEEELRALSPALASDFRQAAAIAIRRLSDDELTQWAHSGVTLAHYSWRSWEAASEYFRATPKVLEKLNPNELSEWSRAAVELGEAAPALATAYARSSVACLDHKSVTQVARWAISARRLYRGTWRSASLAVQLLDSGPRLLCDLSAEEADMLVRFIDILGERSYDLANHCLNLMPQVVSSLAPADRKPFLELALTMAQSAWADSRSYVERGATLLDHLQQSQRAKFLALAQSLATQDGQQIYPLYAAGAKALGQVEESNHPYLLVMAEKLADESPVASMEFLKSAPVVLERIYLDALAPWYEFGREILATNREGGEAYFRLESSRSEEVLDALSSRLELNRVGEVLRLYSKALTGVDVSIHPASALTEKGIGWVSTEHASTEGTSIYLPDVVEKYRDKDANFAVYKVFSTHQAGHLEFGSFLFRFDAPGNIFPTERIEKERNGAHDSATDMERFFNLFEERKLASDIFMMVEDTRIDYLLTREYAGIRSAYRHIQEDEVDNRPPMDWMPMRQMAMESLIRASLGSMMEEFFYPGPVAPLVKEAIETMRSVQSTEATVEDSAEATLRIYQILQRIPNVGEEPPPQKGPEERPEDSNERGEGGESEESGEEAPYESPQPVDFRGDFKPELVQLLSRLRDDQEQQNEELLQLTPEQMRELLEKSVEVDVSEEDEESLDQLLENLMKEAEDSPQGDQTTSDESTPEQEQGELPVQPHYYFYDEWDFRANDYKPRWCRIAEFPLKEGSPHFFEQTHRKYSGLVGATRRQFEMLKPELFRKMKHLLDGEDLDLDAAIEFLVEKQAGHTPPGKVYWRRNKIERDVAVVFLLDMSASTDEEIARRERRFQPTGGDSPTDVQPHLYWWANRRMDAAGPPKRIIDLEKESTVLLIKALETIGDAYGIYGFSGYGRENVEFYVIKDLNEEFSERVKSRIDSISPVRSTRMGPAIRHATTKLAANDAKVKILFLLSDGRPQDHGYGRDRTEKDYAIHDTHMALVEAKRKGIVPFCLTVDRYGHDYLKQMCEDLGYAVVADIESLPQRLPMLYRRLTQ